MTGCKSIAKESVFTIPPSFSFADTLANGLLEETKTNRHLLADYTILLPTRRACRTLREAFLKITEGKPLLLPKIQAIGDIDADELFINMPATLDIPPAISPLKRKLLLTKLIVGLPHFTHGIVQDMALATSLGQLMDQIHTEDKDLKDLPDLVDRQLFADHWQITLDFLEILSENWPKIMNALGGIDASDRRNRLLHALNTHWQNNPPSLPIIAAGSTGSIPSTAALLKTISRLPKGRVVLPGIDLHMSEDAWENVEEGHPQATLKHLMDYLDYQRTDISLWPYLGKASTASTSREWLSSNIMAPAENTDKWQHTDISNAQITDLKGTLSSLRRYDCETIQQEATVIAILLREALETPEKTAALITPDRMLARRVAAICKRWNINLDDSAGQTLKDSSLGQYLSLCIHAIVEDFKPSVFLSLLKQDYCRGHKFENFRKSVRNLDRDLMRGLTPKHGLQGLKESYVLKTNDPKIKNKPDKTVSDLLEHLETVFQPLLENKNNKNSFSSFLTLHIELAEKLASTDRLEGNEALWDSDVGQSASTFLSELFTVFENFPDISLSDYSKIFDQLLSGVTYRPTYGVNPRLMILGQLEARMIRADRIILAGLNEGTWPPEAAHDPWLSRTMKKEFGLPLPERHITLAAHDFSQAFCSPEVFLTRSKKIEGTPTVAARWLVRLDTYLQTIRIAPEDIMGTTHFQLYDELEKVEAVNPVERPAPCPPVQARPRSLSVTRIEKWLSDPYSIYAEKILKLSPLDNLEKPIGYAEKGTLIHEILYRFIDKNRHSPTIRTTEFIETAKEVFNDYAFEENEWKNILPRLHPIAAWFVDKETYWRHQAAVNKLEVKGEMKIESGLSQPFTLTGQADRIDKLHNGTVAIIDYKSAGNFSKKNLKNAAYPQLPLEGLMVQKGAFSKEGLPAYNVGYLGYWTITGNLSGGEVTFIAKETEIAQAIDASQNGLINLVALFDQAETPYFAVPDLEKAPRFNDYAHLERIKEWAVTDDNSEEAA